MLLQMRIEVHLLSGHRLALDDHVRVDVLGNASDDLACFSRVVCPMHLHADALRLRSEAFEVLIQACHGALFDRTCLCPQFLGIAQGCHGGHTARYEVGDQKLQGLLKGGLLKRVPGMLLKTFGTEMLGTAVQSCMSCCVCRHEHTLRT